jgi:ATP-dependent Clp protease ATP-binding subunit ClpA
MFETFSERARRVIFVARLEAGQRGAGFIGVNDLVIGLIAEDQDPNSKDLNEQDPKVKKTMESLPAFGVRLFPPSYALDREPFFSPEVATVPLAKIKGILPRADSIPHNAEMRTSSEFETAIQAAKQLQHEFRGGKVQPLHLLAAALREPCEATATVREAGVTEEKVRRALEAASELDDKDMP